MILVKYLMPMFYVSRKYFAYLDEVLWQRECWEYQGNEAEDSDLDSEE
jgi:hypothetical protein